MAEITVERKPKRPIWPFLLALVVLAAAAWAVWEFYIEPQREVAEAPPVEGASELPLEPYGQPERPPRD